MFVVHVSVAVIRDGRVLMVTESKPDVRGMLNLPGGHLELGESLAEAARREALEETGLKVVLTGIVGVFTTLSARGHHILRFVFGADAGEATPTAGDDIIEVGWHSAEELLGMPDARLAGASMLRDILEKIARGNLASLDSLVESFACRA
jgi:ADP-ribose pyrophosphatase YjhB (NUDIX family)